MIRATLLGVPDISGIRHLRRVQLMRAFPQGGVIVGAAAGVGTATGMPTLREALNLQGEAAGIGQALGQAERELALQGAAAGEAGASAEAEREARLASIAQGLGAASGSIAVSGAVQLAGSAHGVASAAAAIRSALAVEGVAVGSGAAAAASRAALSLAAAGEGAGAVAGAIQAVLAAAGVAVGTGAAAAAAWAVLALAGTAGGTGTAAGVPTIETGGGSPDPTAAYVGRAYIDGANTVYDYTGLLIPSYAEEVALFVGAQSRSGSSGRTITSVVFVTETGSEIAASQIVTQASILLGAAYNFASIFRVVVPAGSPGHFKVTYSGSMARCGIGVAKSTGMAAVAHDTAAVALEGTSNATSTNIDAVAGGFIFSIGGHARSWHTGALLTPASGETDRTITLTPNSVNTGAAWTGITEQYDELMGSGSGNSGSNFAVVSYAPS